MSSCKRRKKGRVKKCINQILYECRIINTKAALAGGVCILILGMISFFVGGSPTYLLHMLKMPVTMPTRWFFKLGWSFWYFILGAAFSVVCTCTERSKQLPKFQGNMLFVIMMMFNLIWYPLFFGAEAIFLALVACIITILLGFFVFSNYLKVNRLCSAAMLLHILWLIYMLCLNAIVLFIN